MRPAVPIFDARRRADTLPHAGDERLRRDAPRRGGGASGSRQCSVRPTKRRPARSAMRTRSSPTRCGAGPACCASARWITSACAASASTQCSPRRDGRYDPSRAGSSTRLDARAASTRLRQAGAYSSIATDDDRGRRVSRRAGSHRLLPVDDRRDPHAQSRRRCRLSSSPISPASPTACSTRPSWVATHRALDARLAAGGARVDAYYYCPHHPEGRVAAYARALRLPQAGAGDDRSRRRSISASTPRNRTWSATSGSTCSWDAPPARAAILVRTGLRRGGGAAAAGRRRRRCGGG